MSVRFHFSEFANKLTCIYCGATNNAIEWPLWGDRVIFSYQDEPGEYSLEIPCEDCGKDWFVVWDSFPGQLEYLSGYR